MNHALIVRLVKRWLPEAPFPNGQGRATTSRSDHRNWWSKLWQRRLTPCCMVTQRRSTSCRMVKQRRHDVWQRQPTPCCMTKQRRFTSCCKLLLTGGATGHSHYAIPAPERLCPHDGRVRGQNCPHARLLLGRAHVLAVAFRRADDEKCFNTKHEQHEHVPAVAFRSADDVECFNTKHEQHEHVPTVSFRRGDDSTETCFNRKRERKDIYPLRKRETMLNSPKQLCSPGPIAGAPRDSDAKP